MGAFRHGNEIEHQMLGSTAQTVALARGRACEIFVPILYAQNLRDPHTDEQDAKELECNKATLERAAVRSRRPTRMPAGHAELHTVTIVTTPGLAL